MKKVPTNEDTLRIFLTGLGLLSFGLLFVWIPVFGMLMLFLGALLVFTAILTVAAKVLK